ncbi:GDP-L-fucose synthase-like [Argopecten irradians]|uniref:GDP-L-fucose synthase-like n=1 Tax=Argopecten irradians TaxID=31199 RepID=UPI0037107C18
MPVYEVNDKEINPFPSNRMAYNEHFGCQFTSIILTNVYGPYDNFHLHKSHVLPGLIHKAYKAKNENTDFTVCGTGTPLRQFIYSLDAGELLVYILRHYPEIDPVLLTVGEDAEVTVKQVAEMVADSIDFKGSIVFDTSKLDGQHKKTATNAKLMKYFPDFKFTPLQQGIKETLKWFMENIDIIRK